MQATLLLLPNISQALSRSPKFALLSEEVRKLLSCTIYEAKAKLDPRVWRAPPQVVMTVGGKTKKKLSMQDLFYRIRLFTLIRDDTFRGFVTTGWDGSFPRKYSRDAGGALSFLGPRTREGLCQPSIDIGIAAILVRLL